MGKYSYVKNIVLLKSSFVIDKARTLLATLFYSFNLMWGRLNNEVMINVYNK